MGWSASIVLGFHPDHDSRAFALARVEKNGLLRSRGPHHGRTATVSVSLKTKLAASKSARHTSRRRQGHDVQRYHFLPVHPANIPGLMRRATAYFGWPASSRTKTTNVIHSNTAPFGSAPDREAFQIAMQVGQFLRPQSVEQP